MLYALPRLFFFFSVNCNTTCAFRNITMSKLSHLPLTEIYFTSYPSNYLVIKNGPKKIRKPKLKHQEEGWNMKIEV